LVGVAVNVTLVPAQMVVALAAMLTLTGKFGFTVMVIVLDVAGLPVPQVAVDVNTHVTVFPLANVIVVNVGELVPAFTPLTFH
jgi:dipeptide/tripeptide permease